MPRSVRVEYAGAVYHVMCRGDRREAIFRDDADYALMLDALEEVCERTGFLVHSYVLMPNHYHLLLETPEPNLVRGMTWFQSTYTQRFNRRHQFHGHLFQGRYKAIPVEAREGDYFRCVSDYVHLNPARAGMLDKTGPNLRHFPWSSFPRFIGQAALPPWLCREKVFRAHDLPDEGAGGRRRYAGLMARRVAEVNRGPSSEEWDEAWRSIRRGWYVGSDSFRDRLMDKIDAAVRGKKRTSYASSGLRRHDEREAERLLQEAMKALEVSLPDLWARRQTDPVKQAVAWWVKSRCVISDEWLCGKLEMGSRTNVSRAVSRYRKGRDVQSRPLKRRLQLCAD